MAYCNSKCAKSHFRSQWNLYATLVAAVLGTIIGLTIPRGSFRDETLKTWVEMPAELYLRGLNFISVPLIATAVITSMSSLDQKSGGIIGGTVFVYNLLCNIIGSSTGAIASIILRPGHTATHQPVPVPKVSLQRLGVSDTFADLLRNLMPDNFIAVAFRKTQTLSHMNNMTLERTVGTRNSPNMLGILTVGVAIGFATSRLAGQGKAIVQLAESLLAVCIVLVQWLIYLTPVGVLSLVIISLGTTDDPEGTFVNLGLLFAAVAGSCLFMTLIILPLHMGIATRRNPFAFYLDIIQPYLLCFLATSTTVALPLLYKTGESKRWRVEPKVNKVAFPLCSALGSQGSAAFAVSSVYFVAAMASQPLTPIQLFQTVLLMSLLMMALPSVPSSSIVLILTTLNSLGINTPYVGLLFSLEWILDRIRTGHNGLSHGTGVLVTNAIYLRFRRKTEDEVHEINEISAL